MIFTESQKKAIHHGNSNLQLIACAGSGKSEVIARRVAHLIKNGARPNNIIAFTFTEKAAAELKERIISRCREELGEVHGMAEMYVGTIHAFCLDLLTAEVPKYLKFDVLNEVQQALFIDRHSNKSGLTASTDLAGLPLKRYRDTPHYRSALGILREADTDDNALKNCSILAGLDSYRSLLDETRHLDYSAIIEAAVDVLSGDIALKQRIAVRVKHVIVDEYQDLNPIQEAIVWLLHELGAKVCVVGDDDQTIYQWRGSSVQGILSFEKRYPTVTTVKLGQTPLPPCFLDGNLFPVYLDAGNVEELRGMDFVFVCLDKNSPKELIVEKLEEFNIPFTDVGMGLQLDNNTLGGIVRVTTSTPQKRDHFRGRVSFEDTPGDDDYNSNI